MVEEEDPELTSSYRHTSITTIYRATTDENDLNTSREELLQLKIYRRNHRKIGKKGRATI